MQTARLLCDVLPVSILSVLCIAQPNCDYLLSVGYNSDGTQAIPPEQKVTVSTVLREVCVCVDLYCSV